MRTALEAQDINNARGFGFCYKDTDATQGDPRMSGSTRLSDRQQQCLWWASKGKTSKETALILGVSERTVNFHLYQAFDKLNVRSKQAAVARAVVLNLL